MDGARVKARRLLEVSVVVVEHRDRLRRVNTELAGAALAAAGLRLVVAGDGAVASDLVRHRTGVLAWLGARLCGRGRARRQVLKVEQDVGPQAAVGVHGGGG